MQDNSWVTKYPSGPLVLVIMAAILSGISGILIRFMEIPPTSMAAVRTGVPTILMAGVIIYNKKSILREGYTWMLGASAINAVRVYAFFIAYIYTSVPNAIIVLYTWPIFATILSVIFLKEHISRRQIVLMGVSFIGILIVYANQSLDIGNRDFIGLSAGILCAFCYASTIIIFKSKSNIYSPVEMIFYQNVLPAVIFIPFLIFNDPYPTNLDWTLSLTHGVLIGVIMFFMFFNGLKHLKASVASVVTYIEVVSAIFLGYIFLGDTMTPSIMLGGGIILFSTALMKNK